MHSIPAVVLPSAPGASTDGELAKEDRKPLLYDLDISYTRVGHLLVSNVSIRKLSTCIDMDGRLSVPRMTGPSTATDGLAIVVLLVVESSHIHATL